MPRNTHYSPVGPRSLRSETQVKKDICDALTALNVPWWRIQCGRVKVAGGWMHGAKNGTADLLASARILRGSFSSGPHFLFIEVKKPGGKQHPEQREFEIECSQRYWMYWLVESVDELLEKIRAAGVIG